MQLKTTVVFCILETTFLFSMWTQSCTWCASLLFESLRKKQKGADCSDIQIEGLTHSKTSHSSFPEWRCWTVCFTAGVSYMQPKKTIIQFSKNTNSQNFVI